MLPDDGVSGETSGSDSGHLYIITSPLPLGVGSGDRLGQKGTFWGDSSNALYSDRGLGYSV